MQDLLLLAVLTAIFAFGWLVAGKLGRFLEENLRTQELYPEVSVRIFCGSEEELLECLSAGKLDVIFLPENTAVIKDIMVI